jgi:hypothetical protein
MTKSYIEVIALCTQTIRCLGNKRNTEDLQKDTYSERNHKSK